MNGRVFLNTLRKHPPRPVWVPPREPEPIRETLEEALAAMLRVSRRSAQQVMEDGDALA